MNPKSRANLTIRSTRRTPSSIQLGISHYATLKSLTVKKQLWMMFTGNGKSRILAALGINLLTLGLATRILMLNPSASLLERDKIDYQDYWSLSGFE